MAAGKRLGIALVVLAAVCWQHRGERSDEKREPPGPHPQLGIDLPRSIRAATVSSTDIHDTLANRNGVLRIRSVVQNCEPCGDSNESIQRHPTYCHRTPRAVDWFFCAKDRRPSR